MFRIARRSMRCSAFPVEKLRAPKFFDEFSEGESTYDEAGRTNRCETCDLTPQKTPLQKTNMDIPNIAIFESIDTCFQKNTCLVSMLHFGGRKRLNAGTVEILGFMPIYIGVMFDVFTYMYHRHLAERSSR